MCAGWPDGSSLGPASHGTPLTQRDTPSLHRPVAPGDTANVRSVDDVIAGLARETRRYVGRVWAPSVSVEGPIAVFVAPYDSWYDGRFTSCGMDHYILVRSGERWLVSQLVFTRQRERCVPSPLGEPR